MSGHVKPALGDAELPSPIIEQDGQSVVMSFDDTSIQSRMRLDDPTALDLDYSRAMMAFLLMQPQPESILMIGLGGRFSGEVLSSPLAADAHHRG